ncbi:MAG: HD domain-containing protein [Vallitaleaceae bacterium]|nr:HD domain-containing protein [Vallitaleaceae bacterium]
MYKRLMIFTVFIGVLAVFVIFVGTTYINNSSWEKMKTDFYDSKISQVDYFFEKMEEDVESLVDANAPWTDLQQKIEEQNVEWLRVNATGYLVNTSSFKIDYVMAANEELTFINQYGDPFLDPIMKTNSFKHALKDDYKSSEILWIEGIPVLIVASPILNNDFENPMGVYVLGRKLTDENLNDLRFILGKDIISNMTFSKEASFDGLMVKDYTYINFSHEVIMKESRDFINIEFCTPLYKNLFYYQKIKNVLVIGLTVLFFFATWFLFIGKVSKGVVEVIDVVKKISLGDYDVRVNASNIEEVKQLAFAVNKMATDITSQINEIDSSYLSMIEVLANSVEINNEYTSHHNMRVANFARVIGEALSFKDMDTLNIAARLHDIGKLAIPQEIVNKPGKLTPEEYQIIKEHPTAGFQIMGNIDFFKDIKWGILYHHERYDGLGYPEGLKGDEIPLIAQIISVADVFDALASDRPYRKAFNFLESLELLKENSGKMFNPAIVDVFVAIMEDLYDLSLSKRE